MGGNQAEFKKDSLLRRSAKLPIYIYISGTSNVLVEMDFRDHVDAAPFLHTRDTLGAVISDYFYRVSEKQERTDDQVSNAGLTSWASFSGRWVLFRSTKIQCLYVRNFRNFVMWAILFYRQLFMGIAKAYDLLEGGVCILKTPI